MHLVDVATSTPKAIARPAQPVQAGQRLRSPPTVRRWFADHPWRWIAALAVFYAAAGIGCMQFARTPGMLALIWVPSGIALAASLLCRRRVYPALFAGSLANNLYFDVALAPALAIAAANTLEVIVASALIRTARIQLPCRSVRDVLGFTLLGAFLPATISATLGTPMLLWDGIITVEEFSDTQLHWWLSDLTGVLIVTPILLPMLQRRLTWPGNWPAFEAVALLLAMGLVSSVTFFAPGPRSQVDVAASLAVYSFVIWAALRFGHWGASLGTLFVSIAAILGTVAGYGPFAAEGAYAGVFRWSVFVITIATTGQLLAALSAQRKRSQHRLKRSHQRLAQRVAERTQALSLANAVVQREVENSRHLETQLLRIGESVQQAVGREIHDGLGQVLMSMAMMSATAETQLGKRPPAETAALLRRLCELAEQAGQTAHTICRGLVPVALQQGGLPVALESLAAQVRDVQGIVCTLAVDGQAEACSPESALQLYRIAQEAITNAIRHGQATRLAVRLRLHASSIVLSVADDGVGFDVEAVAARPALSMGLGLASMQVRTRLLHGQLRWQRLQPRGMALIVRCPAAPVQHDR